MRKILPTLLLILSTLLFALLLQGGAAVGEGTTRILLTGDGAAVEGDGAAVYGEIVTIYSAGRYELSGELNGQLIVDTSLDYGVVTLILRDAAISCADGPALWIERAERVELLTASGTDNALRTEAADAPAIYAEEELGMDGEGSLSLYAADGDGVFCRQSLALRGGRLTVEADRRGLHARKHMAISGGELEIRAGRKGLSAKRSMTISGGRIRICAGGDGISTGVRGDQYREGIGTLTLSGGELLIDAYKAPVDAWGGMLVTGGSLFGTGRTKRIQAVSEESTQAVLLKLSEGEPGESVRVLDTDGSILFEAVPSYAYDFAICTDAGILRGFRYIVASQRASYPVLAK